MKEIIPLFSLIMVLAGCSENLDAKPVSKTAKAEKTESKPDEAVKDSVRALECDHTDLSATLDFRISFKRIPNVHEYDDSCIVNIAVIDKASGKINDRIRLSSSFFYDFMFKDCEDVRSYATGKNKEKEVADNFYGDLIVADFNFDSRDDLAVIRDAGGNGGPLYSYYVQQENGKFRLDPFLTDSMVYFPTEINPKRRKLVTLVHANAYEMSERTFKIQPGKKSWKMIRHRFVQ